MGNTRSPLRQTKLEPFQTVWSATGMPSAPETDTGFNPAALLRQAGLRVTKPRQAVLSAVHAHPHSHADTLVAHSRADVGHVSLQAVYDVLHALTRAGVLRRMEPAGSPARYELDRGDNHHHLACRSCGGLVDVPCAQGAAPCLDPLNSHGFAVDEAEVIYWGLCPTCQQERATTASNSPTTATSVTVHEPSTSAEIQRSNT